MIQREDLIPADRQAIEEFEQFLKWAVSPDHPGPYIHLAHAWYNGLMTTKEGQRIEEGRQVWQLAGGDA